MFILCAEIFISALIIWGVIYCGIAWAAITKSNAASIVNINTHTYYIRIADAY